MVSMPIGDEVARLPQEWYLNTPVLWLGALVLLGLVRGPLRNAPTLLKKPLKFAAATLLALGFAIFLLWGPVQQAARHSSALIALWVLFSGLTPIALIISFFRIFFSRAKQTPAMVSVAASSQALRPSAPIP